jgi:hypothetical protein
MADLLTLGVLKEFLHMAIAEASPGPSQHEDPSQRRQNPLLASLIWLWNRYSPHGEFPISTAVSTIFHIVLFALIGMYAVKLLPPEREPVAVATVRVGPDPEAARGEENLPSPGDSLVEGVPENSPVPDQPPQIKPAEKVAELEAPPIAETGPKPVTEAIARDVQDAKSAAARAARALSEAREALQRNLAEKSGGGKRGGGGGSGLTGRAARPARWIITFNFSGVDDYLEQLEGLGAVVAFPAQGNNWRFFSKPSSKRTLSVTRDLATESRFYWVNDDSTMAHRVATALGLSGAQFLTVFLPLELEERMVELETSYMNLEEDEIASTRFQCIPAARGYDIKVAGQIPK